MENPAQPTDLTSRGYSGTASTTVQQTWLDVSFRALRRDLLREGVNLDAAVDAGTFTAADVVDVVVAAAKRILNNPDGVSEESGGLDDYTESVKRSDSTEDVYFTAAELRRLTPVTSGSGWTGSLRYS